MNARLVPVLIGLALCSGCATTGLPSPTPPPAAATGLADAKAVAVPAPTPVERAASGPERARPPLKPAAQDPPVGQVKAPPQPSPGTRDAGKTAAAAAASPPVPLRSPVAAASAVPAAVGVPKVDLDSLKVRLKETRAIDVFTKIALQNRFDDLLDRLRRFHRGRLESTLSELRLVFDQLVQDVLVRLRGADPLLAHAIDASRESIWRALSDPAGSAGL